MTRLVLVSGSRDFPSKPLVLRIMEQSLRPDDCLIHGCARGVDSWAEQVAVAAGISVRRRPADWNRYGRQAGLLRNVAMLEETLAVSSYLILIFWDGHSRGTKHMIDACQARGARYSVVNSVGCPYSSPPRFV